MMAFFLVMWLVGQSKSVKEGIGGYFRDPAVFESVGGKGVLPGADSIEEPKAQMPITDAETEKRRLEAAVEHIKETLDSNPALTIVASEHPGVFAPHPLPPPADSAITAEIPILRPRYSYLTTPPPKKAAEQTGPRPMFLEPPAFVSFEEPPSAARREA